MNRFEHLIHTARREEGELVARPHRRAVGRVAGGAARRRGRGHRGLPQLVVLRAALHQHAGLRLRLRVRPAARARGLRPLRGGGRGLRARLPATCCAPAARCRPRSSGGSSGSTSPTRASGTAGSTWSSASSRPPRRPRAKPAASSRRPRSRAAMIRATATISSTRTRSSTACASSIPVVPTITVGIPRAVKSRMSAPQGTPATGASPRSAATAARTRATHGCSGSVSPEREGAAGPGQLDRRVLGVGGAHRGLERGAGRRRVLPHAHAEAALEDQPVRHGARPLAGLDAADVDRIRQRERAHRRMRDVGVDARRSCAASAAWTAT